MRGLSRLVPFLIAAFGLAAGAALADEKSAVEKPQASGKFESKDWEVEISGAYAFPGEVGFDKEEGILVAVANTSFATEKLDRLWDRRHVIDSRIASQEVLVTYFQFSKDGKYYGYSFYFGPGDGCGHCFDSPESTVKVQNGRIAGKLKNAPKPGEFPIYDIEFDVPVATRDYGKALPAGFGEFAKLYEDFHQALNKGPASALAPHLTDAEAKDLETVGEDLLKLYRENHPTESYQIKKGFESGERVMLLVEGRNSFAGIASEVHFVREGGRWRIFDEIGSLKIGE